MAGANTYVGRFIGNDFSQPTRPRTNTKITTVSPTPQVAITAAPGKPIAEPNIIRYREEYNLFDRIYRLISIRSISLCIALILSLSLVGVAVVGMTNSSLLNFATTRIATVTAALTSFHRTVQTTLPAFSIAVKTQNEASIVNKIEAQPIIISYAGSSVMPTSQNIASWIKVSPSGAANATILTINTTAVTNYINGIVKQNTRLTMNQLVVTHPDGSSLMLISGQNGLTFGDPSGVIAQIDNGLFTGNGLNPNLPSVSTPFQSSSSSAYPKVIEVDLTNHQLYVYQSGKLVRDFGINAGSSATSTPMGDFAITSKYVNQNVVTNTGETTTTYPDVQSVQYFNNNYAFLADTWDPATDFGTTNATQGDVGLSTTNATWLYNWSVIGTTVVVHN